ncbi:Ribosome-releasing factor 2 mitochondrial [Bienertia sinuspersici]
MGETLLTTLSIENYHPSTVLSMDSSSSSHDESERDVNRSVLQLGPPDINLPLSVEPSSLPQLWNDSCEILDVGVGPQIPEGVAIVNVPKVGRKCAKRVDTIWGAWFFFNYYFKPVLKDSSKCKVTRDSNGWSGFDKSDLKLDAFLVQHDMENIYMWVFKEKPENALGKMQLRSFMNGHSRQGEHPFPFSVDRGFVRSHKMQRKHYRGLSNPQCVHGIELVGSPDFAGIDENEKKRWFELTGRDTNFSIPEEASDFGSWRNFPPLEFELERPSPSSKGGAQRKVIPVTGLNFSGHASKNGHSNSNGNVAKKQKKDSCPNGSVDNGFLRINSQSDNGVLDVESHFAEPVWTNEFSGVMKNVNGPVTAAKSIYEDEEGFLIIVSLPFADLQRVRVTWKNSETHGIVKVACVSTACSPLIKRQGRTFKLTDQMPEHCPPGEFVREISLPTRIPEDAKLEAYCDETGAVLEIMVPKQLGVLEEHEVQVCRRPSPWV